MLSLRPIAEEPSDLKRRGGHIIADIYRHDKPYASVFIMDPDILAKKLKGADKDSKEPLVTEVKYA